VKTKSHIAIEIYPLSHSTTQAELSRQPDDHVTWARGVAREILIRGAHVQGQKMLTFVVICIVLAISATYKLIKWGVAMAIGQDATEFLGTQGDSWDPQPDMGFALIDVLVAQVLLSHGQNRQIEALART
jgi:putative membrane protein